MFSSAETPDISLKITPLPKVDVSVPSIARVQDYWLGGKDNFAADRELGDKLQAQYPATGEIVRENKQFIRRAVTWVAEQGIGQFIDVGAGLPTAPSTLQTAQATAPDAKVVSVDNDPIVVSHLRALLASHNPAITVVERDLRDVAAVVADAAAVLDLGEPVGLVLGSLLHFFPVEEGQALLGEYAAALVPGSYVIVSLGRSRGEQSEEYIRTYRQGGVPLYYYGEADIAALFHGLSVVPPGITVARAWGVDRASLPPVGERYGEMAAAIARVP